MREHDAQAAGCMGPQGSGGPAPARVCGRWLGNELLGHREFHLAASFVAMIALAIMLVVSSVANAAPAGAPTPTPAPPVTVIVSFGPPAIPYYVQPPLIGPRYIWVPGYWAWDPYYGYYWVPGMWVLAPLRGALWTPGYWRWSDPDDGFIWIPGYWGPVVGYYGGINYGCGYFGRGFQGGYWRGGDYYYNRSVTNISNTTNITNVYNTTVIENQNASRVSYNGGVGGTTARPTSEELAAERQRRSWAAPAQRQQEQAARRDPRQRASVNQGRPAVAATMRAGEFSGRGVVAASREGAPYKAPPSPRAHPRATESTPSRGSMGRGAQPSPSPRRENRREAPPNVNVTPAPRGHQPPPSARSAERPNQMHYNAKPERQSRPGPPPRGRAEPQQKRQGQPEKPNNQERPEHSQPPPER